MLITDKTASLGLGWAAMHRTLRRVEAATRSQPGPQHEAATCTRRYGARGATGASTQIRTRLPTAALAVAPPDGEAGAVDHTPTPLSGGKIGRSDLLSSEQRARDQLPTCSRLVVSWMKRRPTNDHNNPRQQAADRRDDQKGRQPPHLLLHARDRLYADANLASLRMASASGVPCRSLCATVTARSRKS